MLTALTALARTLQAQSSNGYQWFSLNHEQIQNSMPFWQPADIQRIATNLREQGLLLMASAPYTSSRQLKFAFNERTSAPPRMARPEIPPTSPTKNLINPGWQPDRETLARIAQHNIPSTFAGEQVPEFVNYWRERGEAAHSWGSKFMRHVIHKWRTYQAQQHARNQAQPMYREWRPSEDALEVLTTHAGISPQFVEDAIAEFVLYWREQNATSDNWNKKFRDHVQRQWLRYCSALEHDTVPRRISDNWTPSHDVYEVLRLANIDVAFAQALLPEFVIYWRDSNQVHSSWNTRFLQYVKQRWAKRSAGPEHKSTRELTIAEQLNDRSWAL